MSNAALWQRLENKIAYMVDDFPGVAGVCVKDLKHGDGFAIRGDEEFPTASTIKIHILTQFLLRAERGEIDLSQKLRLTPEMHVSGSGVIPYLDGKIELSWLNIATLMIIVSDDSATNLCIDMAGIDATNGLLRELGLTRTTLRRKMEDLDAVAHNEENIATPAECVAMLELLYTGKPTPAVAERCLSILKMQKTGPLFNRAIPADVPLASKPGYMERVRCDAGIVYLPRRPYAMAIMTKSALYEPPRQERFVIDAAWTIHQTMAVLDGTNDYGQGIRC